jgi:hypothetical protein
MAFQRSRLIMLVVLTSCALGIWGMKSESTSSKRAQEKGSSTLGSSSAVCAASLGASLGLSETATLSLDDSVFKCKCSCTGTDGKTHTQEVTCSSKKCDDKSPCDCTDPNNPKGAKCG